MFTPEQKAVLLRYFDEYGMTSTHRRNADMMQRCANEVGTTIDRIKVGASLHAHCIPSHDIICTNAGAVMF